jgi:hypothetical protein
MSVTDDTELTPLTPENGVPPANGMPGEGEANDANNGAESLLLIRPKSVGTRNGAIVGVVGGRCMEARRAGDGTIGTILTAARFLALYLAL